MEEEKTFELVPVIDDSTGKYVVQRFDVIKAIVSGFIEREVSKVGEIEDDATFKVVKATRADIRKKKEAITQARIHINALLLGEFNSQLREIEGMLDLADKTLKGKVDSYNESKKGKVEKPTVITLVIKGYDRKSIEAIKSYANQRGLSVEEK